jgi:hypothetical protein
MRYLVVIEKGSTSFGVVILNVVGREGATSLIAAGGSTFAWRNQCNGIRCASRGRLRASELPCHI